jgi:uracil-DNA glycosylase family 4
MMQPQWPSSTPCKIAFVGDAPRDEDTIMQKPMMGGAGKVFNGLLRGANIERTEHLVTNVFDTQPDGDIKDWLVEDERFAKACARLQDEIATCQPNVIVPMGAGALWAFTRSSNIQNFRGAVVKASHIVPGAKLVPTFHPEVIQKTWKWLPMATADLVKAVREAEIGPQVVYPKVTLMVEPTLKEALEFCKLCLKSDLLSTDIETGWGQITCIGLGPTANTAMCIPFVDLRKPNKCYWPTLDAELQVWQAIREVMESDVPKLGQNFLYDVFWMYKRANIKIMNYRHDTRLQHHALYPELPKDLASMGANYTNLGAWKNWSGRYEADKRDS